MTRLLDHIFQNVTDIDLNKSQIEAYIRYLDELIAGGLPEDKEQAYQNLKRQLLKRWQELN